MTVIRHPVENGRLPCMARLVSELNRVYETWVDCTVHGKGQPGYTWIGKQSCVACHCSTCAAWVNESIEP